MEKQTCEWIIDRAPKKGQRCQIKPIEGRTFCSKHNKRMASREARQPAKLDTDEVFGTPAPAPRNKFSVFNFTFSTNRDVDKLSREQKLVFKTAVDGLFDPGQNGIIGYLRDSKSEDPAQNIVKSQTLFRYEVGSREHRLHAHCQLLLEHTGHYRIDTAALREDLKNQTGYVIYVKVDAQTDHVAAYAAYITKRDAAIPYDFDTPANNVLTPATVPISVPTPTSVSAPTYTVDLPEPVRRRAATSAAASPAGSVLAKYKSMRPSGITYDSIKM